MSMCLVCTGPGAPSSTQRGLLALLGSQKREIWDYRGLSLVQLCFCHQLGHLDISHSSVGPNSVKWKKKNFLVYSTGSSYESWALLEVAYIYKKNKPTGWEAKEDHLGRWCKSSTSGITWPPGQAGLEMLLWWPASTSELSTKSITNSFVISLI